MEGCIYINLYDEEVGESGGDGGGGRRSGRTGHVSRYMVVGGAEKPKGLSGGGRWGLKRCRLVSGGSQGLSSNHLRTCLTALIRLRQPLLSVI